MAEPPPMASTLPQASQSVVDGRRTFSVLAGLPFGGYFKSVRPKDGFGSRSFPAMDRFRHISRK